MLFSKPITNLEGIKSKFVSDMEFKSSYSHLNPGEFCLMTKDAYINHSAMNS